MQKSINEQYNVLIESRLTKLETLIENHEKTFERIERKIDKHFFWVLGLIVSSLVIPYLNAYLRYKGIAI